LNSLVNCLRDEPMTQFSIHWILSLKRLHQKWGQVLYRIVMPPKTLAWLREDRGMQVDRARLSKACCRPAKFTALQGSPVPVSIECSTAP
jgi:hypothetical protein